MFCSEKLKNSDHARYFQLTPLNSRSLHIEHGQEVSEKKSLSPEALQLLLCSDSSRDKYGLNKSMGFSTDESESATFDDDDDENFD